MADKRSKPGNGTGRTPTYQTAYHGGDKTNPLSSLARIIVEKFDKRRVPETTIDTIPFDQIYPDGLCRIGNTFYSRMVQFYDINYQLAQNDEKQHEFCMEKTKKLWGEIIVGVGGQKIEWCYTDVLYSFKSMYLLGIKAKYPELVEVCGHTIRPQNRKSPRELACSEDFILSCVDKCRELNNYQGLQQFIDVCETVGNVIPVWPGGNVYRGQFCCYDCPDIYFNNEKIRDHAVAFYYKYSNSYMCGDDAIIAGIYNNMSVKNLINMDKDEYENYIEHAINVIKWRTEKIE